MKIHRYGMLSEVCENGKVLHVGSLFSCENYMNDNQIVGRNEFDEGVTRQGLKEYFELVQDYANYKNPVSKAISNDITAHEEYMISRAVTFFTGSVAKWTFRNGLKWIEFKGYYKAIGA
jgi:hypothetical protein